MSKYTGSVDMGYQQDPNNPTKMIPADKPDYLWPHVTTPASGSVVGRPSYVLIHNDNNGVQFLFETTASIGATINTPGQPANTNVTWVDFGTTKTIADGGSLARLDISPVAWSGSGTATNYADGNVLFVYNDGRQAS